MEVHRLPFATINILQDDIAEVIINEGIEMDLEMVGQYHDFLLNHLHHPFSLLINKLNSYTYDFQAQQKLATLDEINCMAVVVYTDIARESTSNLASFPRETQWNMQIFYDRNDGLNWVKLQQDNIQHSSQ